eukprot:9484784-Pyramimonas_sp.AAC.1
MLAALERFGLPSSIRRIVGDIYNGRTFQVQEAGHLSAERAQRSGISQGCPLSPLLFVMVMTVIMTDAADALGQQLAERVGQLVYANDTDRATCRGYARVVARGAGSGQLGGLGTALGEAPVDARSMLRRCSHSYRRGHCSHRQNILPGHHHQQRRQVGE